MTLISFCPMYELMEQMELFSALGNEAIVIVDEPQLAHEVRVCFGMREVLHSLNSSGRGRDPEAETWCPRTESSGWPNSHLSGRRMSQCSARHWKTWWTWWTYSSGDELAVRRSSM